MAIVAQQVSILAIFALVGFVFARIGLIQVEQSKLLSTLVVYLCFPCTVYKTFSSNFTVQYLTENYTSILLSAAILIVVVIAAKLIARLMSQKPYERNVYGYSLIVPNFGYMGTALVESLYGSSVLFGQLMFNLPITFFTYTEGYRMLTGGEKMSFKKLLNPATVAILLGCLAGMLNFTLPSIPAAVVDRANNCMAPLSMLLTGVAISEFKLGKLLTNKKAYFTVLMRLLVIPCTLAGVVTLLGAKSLVLPILMLYAMPCGLNTIVFPKLIGEDCEIGASLALVSNLLAILTIPLCVAVFLG